MYSFGKKSIIVVLVLFIIIAVVGWAWRQRDSLPFITKPLQIVAAPFEYGASRIMDTLSSTFHIVDISLKNRIEWESLEKENAELKERSVDYDEILAENKRYRELLDFKAAHRQFNVRAGSVISRDYGTWSNTMVIDIGSEDGIEENMAVVTPAGVVGFISDVYPHSSRVQLLTDPRTSIGAIVQRPESRVSSVVRGNGNVPTEPQFVNIAKDADILEGDTLVTSGFGSIYPKGLYIGTIVSIHQDDNDFVKYAVIRPGVDFSKLEEVFVITHSTDNSSYEKPDVSPKLVPQTQRDKVEGVKGAAAL
ncbi:rod shape-determining protein MreC [uncultured Megasphaera sp.]|uniref:rod shape-determining protein MreC n=1 Tax=uncultured Megasphaera sp. TaxID=165188 RepID=UPI003783EF4F